ncbi:MAG: UDP-2,3-diacylglucosamine diphosphatase [Bacteroidota bacterium]
MSLTLPDKITLSRGQKVYFASDFHLGINGHLPAREREQQIVRWLAQIKSDAAAIFLVGDLFEFWFEYKRAVPRGYIRFLGKLAELRDEGIPVFVFTGNHDMWLFDYFPNELDIPIIRSPISININDANFLIGHGDGLGPDDYGYKRLKRIFANPLCQWAFARLHPNFGIGMAWFWSGKSRGAQPVKEEYYGPAKEWLIQYCERKLESQYFQYFIFGHRHLPIDYTLSNGQSRYLNLGEWINFNSYAVFDGQALKLHFFENENGKIFG